MKNLQTLFNCNIDLLVSGIEINSKFVKKGDLFLCRKGVNSDGHDFIDEAIKNGAQAIVVNKDVGYDVPTIKVEDVNKIIPEVLDWYYGKPNDKFTNIIGVTGTAGKTTTCQIIYHILSKYYNSAYFGSLGIKSSIYNINEFDTLLTTYAINYLYENLEKMYQNGVENIIIETSSEGLKQNRTGNIKYDVALITNLSECHMFAHKNMEDYINSKMKLFMNLKSDGIAILNIDDEYYKVFENIINCKKMTYGKSVNATLRFDNVKYSLSGTSFNVYYNKAKYEVNTNLIGEYNVYNICASLCCLLTMNLDIKNILPLLNNIFVNGRMNVLETKGNFNVVADIGINLVGLKKNLSYLSDIKKNKIITVIGVSGLDWDIHELNKFGKIASDLSDYVIYTSNRNYKENKTIINNLIKLINRNNYEVIYDRKEAILKALEMASKDDIVLISGSESFVVKKGETPLDTKKLVKDFF